MVTILPPVTVSPEEKRQVLERVLKSQTFSRSDQLRRFLQYICEKDIAGESHHLNEYSIAVEALGRPAHYSPAEDSSVRTRAHALRQKLQEYYGLEEIEAELKIQVPKGSYHPQFLRAQFMPETVAEAPFLVDTAVALPPAIQLPAPGNRLFWRPFLAGMLAAVLMLSAATALVRLVRPWHLAGNSAEASSIDVSVRQLWGQMLRAGEEVEICIGTPPAMLLHSYRDGQLPPIGPHLLPTPKEVSSWYEGLQMADGGGKLFMHQTQDVFLFGDSLAASSAAQLISRAGAVPQVMPESNLRAFVLRGRNVLLIGSPNYSPLAARFLMNAPLSVHYDPVKGEEVVSDGIVDGSSRLTFRPLHNEHGMLTQAYGLITILPSQPPGMGEAKTIVLSGITSAGPQAALEFLRSGDSLRVLTRKLKEQGYDKYPAAIQIVVRCSLDHNLALSWEYAAHQVLQTSLFSK